MDNSLETEEQRKKRINDEIDRRIYSIRRNEGGYITQVYNGGIVSTEFVPNRQHNRGRDD